MIRSTYRKYRLDIRIGLLVFILAAVPRLLYQYESIPLHPLMKDARQYFVTAFNLHRFGAFSDEWTSFEGFPPRSRTDLRPGYPVFLSFFIREPVHILDFLQRVFSIQALSGALTTLLAFCIARMCLPVGWAALAGLLTATSPHLIAIDGYLLTESLFAFLLTAALLSYLIAWKHDRSSMFFLVGVLLAMSNQVRAVNQMLPLVVAVLILFRPGAKGPANLTTRGGPLVFFLAGCLLISGTNYLFRQIAAVPLPGGDAQRVYGSSAGFRTAFLYGSYPGMKDGRGRLLRETDPELPAMMKDAGYAIKVLRKRFVEEPTTYLKWYFGGKVLALWKWDDDYVHDVYVYPMKRKGFEENPLLRPIHRAARAIHWPVFLLTLSAPLWMFFAWRARRLPDHEKLLLPIICVFFYYMAVFSILQPLTRYLTPIRPLAYIMTAASLAWLTGMLASRIKKISERSRR